MKLTSKWALLTIVLVLTLGLAACGGTGGEVPGDDYTSEDNVVVIECEEAGEIELSVADFMDLEAVSEEIVRLDDNGDVEEQYSIKGVLLETVLAHLEIGIGDLGTVRFTAGDGYSVEVPNNIVAGGKIILAYEIDGEPLHENTGPIRIFIPDEESMYWVRNTVKINLNRGESGGSQDPSGEIGVLEQIIFFETLLPELEVLDYIAEADAKAVKTEAVFADVQAGSLVQMLASDGFEKNEEFATAIEQYVVVEGENTPAFRGPDLPRGMHVRDLVWMGSGDTGFLFVKNGLEYFDEAEVDGDKGISLKDIADKFSLKEADTYILESDDGYSVEISYEELEAGIVFFRDSGEISSAFEGLPKNTAVKGLLSIRVAD
ncbi:MAG: hypothetical protein FH749_12615 [Firmicutes bacterium]|nr:hypothetical protein [Bacillota bacterium]